MGTEYLIAPHLARSEKHPIFVKILTDFSETEFVELRTLLKPVLWILRASLIVGVATGCAAVEENSLSTSSAPPVTTYSCLDYGKYDDITTCNNTTLAQCEASWQSFPNGGLQPCYSPVEGGEVCLLTSVTHPPEWIYSEVTGPEATYCKTKADGSCHHRLRSLVGCSSQICLCQGQIALYNVLNWYNASSTPAVPNNSSELWCPGYTPSSTSPCP